MLDDEDEELREELAEQQFYASAGYCIVTYQRIEDALSGLFSALLRTDSQRAAAAWREIRGLDPKLKAISSLFALANEEEVADKWKEILRRTRSAQAARDEIAHGAVTIFGGGISIDLEKSEARRLGPSQLELHKAIRGEKPSRWNVQRMVDEGQRLDGLYSDLLNLIVDLRESG